MWNCCAPARRAQARSPRWRPHVPPARLRPAEPPFAERVPGSVPGLAPRLTRALTALAYLVVLEVAGELGGALVLEQTLEAPPRGIAGLLAATLGKVEVLDDLVEIDVTVANDGFVCFRLLAHAGRLSGRNWTART